MIMNIGGRFNFAFELGADKILGLNFVFISFSYEMTILLAYPVHYCKSFGVFSHFWRYGCRLWMF